MGTIGTYHYDDATCARVVEATKYLVVHLADEAQTQGPTFVELYLRTIGHMVGEELTRRGDVTRALAVTRGQGFVDGPPPTSTA